MIDTGIFEQALAEHRARKAQAKQDAPSDARGETTVGAETVDLGDADTTGPVGDTFLGASNLNGVPRGTEAYEARQIAQSAPFQSILNAINDQLLGGELAFPSDDDDVDQAEADLKTLVGDVLRGPHHGEDDIGDLVSAWVADMATVGDAFAEFIAPASGDLPFVALKTVDALTMRYHVDDSGDFNEPAFYQAPIRSGDGSAFVSVGQQQVTPLERDQMLHMKWPGSNRSHDLYPLAPALQVKSWLTMLADSTTHHGRYYSDNELPVGMITSMDSSTSDVERIRDELQAAKGDPRKAAIVGTNANWVEVGGSAVDLNVIEEQEWFYRLVAAAFGISPQELGLIEDVNRSTAESQESITHKRVTSKVANTIGQALTQQALPKFDLWTQLDAPFRIEWRFSDPAQERAQEAHAREQYQAGLMTYREYREAVGDDMSEADTTVLINGEEIDYGAYPKPVVESLLVDARNNDPPGAGGAPDA